MRITENLNDVDRVSAARTSPGRPLLRQNSDHRVATGKQFRLRFSFGDSIQPLHLEGEPG
jgi:hypothetical protein